MPYSYPNAKALENLPTVGNGQCVSLVKSYANAPASSTWKAGRVVRGSYYLESGTAIATFVNGKYQNNSTGNHAALYIGQDSSGIIVIDQWSTSGKIRKRHLPFLGRDSNGNFIDSSNNGDAFSVIE